MDNLDQLANFISRLTFEDLPDSVIKRAKQALRDTIGVILGGMREPEVAALAEYAVGQAPGKASLFGHPGTVTAPWAALVHGTAGTTLEMDEGHAFARGHAAIHAVPTALALGQANRADGRQVIAALVAGYEVAARAGIAARLRGPVHPFGAWGVLGAAAVAAWYKGLEARDFRGVLELAASYAISPSFETAYQGATVRNTYAGMVNRMGMLAADFYELGFRGERGGLETTFGRILGKSFEPVALSAGLGESYEIMRGYFKPYSGCRYTHAAIEAVLGLQAEQAIEIENLDAVEVATYDIAARLRDPAPRTPLAARFSTPYVVAAVLTKGCAGPEIFTPEMLADPGIASLASRISVVENPEYTAMTPARRPARVKLMFRDGATLEKVVYGSKGDPDQPMTAVELEAKFNHLGAPLLGPKNASRAWRELGRLEKWTRLDGLADLLAPEFGAAGFKRL